jgi:predicted RNase H-like HicB family nuclease
MNITFETERETDVRWIEEVPELADVMAYGSSEGEANAKAESLALRALADRIDHRSAKMGTQDYCPSRSASKSTGPMPSKS